MIKEPKKIVIINIIIKAIVNVLNIIGFKKNVDHIKKMKKDSEVLFGNLHPKQLLYINVIQKLIVT